MIRYTYIYNQVLQIYKSLPTISFPLDMEMVYPLLSRCRVLTYQQFAQISYASINDVILLCDSKSGCTHYDFSTGRYLILWNSDGSENNVEGRRRWTQAHEAGHVALKHLPVVATQKLAENSFNNLAVPEYEVEANMFASTLLCPMPLFEQLAIQSPHDIQRTFGLSSEASAIRWTAYEKWKLSHRKTFWENDIKRLYSEQNRAQKYPHYSR